MVEFLFRNARLRMDIADEMHIHRQAELSRVAAWELAQAVLFAADPGVVPIGEVPLYRDDLHHDKYHWHSHSPQFFLHT